VEISTTQTGEFAEVNVRGRLDAYWSTALAGALDELVRNGQHRIRLNLSQVAYMSSAGIRVLLRFYKQLQPINGVLVVSHPSEAVKSVLDLAGLQVLLKTAEPESEAASMRGARQIEVDDVVFEVHERQPDAWLVCRAIGEPQRLATGGFNANDCRTLTFTAPTFGVGLGAFGNSFEDCSARFGEFLAAGGAAAYLPTDGSNVPDYMVAVGALIPEVRALYALVGEGAFARLGRFEQPHGRPAVTLTQLAQAALRLAQAETAGMVIIAETVGLVGASLLRSPAHAAIGADFFDHPGVRDHLSYSPERAHARSLALIVGIATRSPAAALANFVRPLGENPTLLGHLHAAAFSYQPLQKGEIELQPTIANLFESQALQGVMHLIGDDREITGVGESELLRGAIWVGPIGEVTAE
jgi:anti-anti-sigma factor